MKNSPETKRVRQILAGIQSGEIKPRPDFQRNLVWSNRDKLAFLDTVLRGYPFPEIYMATGEVNLETAEGTELLVDGQQRVTTLHQYFINSPVLKLDATIKPYRDLSVPEKEAFLNYEVAVRHLGIIETHQIIEVFRRINSTSYALNAMEVDNARYNGPLKKCAEWMAKRDFFANHGTFSLRETRRMRDVVYSVTIIISMLATYFHRDDAISEFLERYNDEFPEDEAIRERFTKVTSFIEDCQFPSTSRAWKKTDLLVLIVELDRLINKEHILLNPDKVGPAVEEFYHRVDAELAETSGSDSLQVYFKTTVQATNDRSARVNRGKVLRAVILSTKESPQLV